MTTLIMRELILNLVLFKKGIMKKNLTDQNDILSITKTRNCMGKIFAQRVFLILSLCCLLAVQTYAQVGTWTAVTRLAPHDNNGVMVLLSDGSVICHNTS